MEHAEYIQSSKPLRVSGIALAVTSLLPISVLVFEGWHSGVPWAAFLALLIAVFMPGIYLIRPLVFSIWVALVVIISVASICTIEYYWNSVPDWMDAEIPKWISYSINMSLRLILATSVALGLFGWLRYFKRRRSHN